MKEIKKGRKGGREKERKDGRQAGREREMV